MRQHSYCPYKAVFSLTLSKQKISQAQTEENKEGSTKDNKTAL